MQISMNLVAILLLIGFAWLVSFTRDERNGKREPFWNIATRVLRPIYDLRGPPGSPSSMPPSWRPYYDGYKYDAQSRYYHDDRADKINRYLQDQIVYPTYYI